MSAFTRKFAKTVPAAVLALCVGCASVHTATDFSGVKVEEHMAPIDTEARPTRKRAPGS